MPDGEIVDIVDLDVERKGHVVTHQLEAFGAETGMLAHAASAAVISDQFQGSSASMRFACYLARQRSCKLLSAPFARFFGLEGCSFRTPGIRSAHAIRFRNGRLFEADTGLPAICELDPSLLKCSAQRINSPLLQFFAALKPGNCVDRDLRCCGEVSNAHAQSRSSHTTLHR
jgi:hypothetical protein